MSEEASECRRGPEGGLNVQRAADQVDLLTETFDVGQHQLDYKDVVPKGDPSNTAWSGLTYCRVDSICIPCA